MWDAHYAMLLLTYAVTITSRGLITLEWSFGPMLALALVMEAAVAPMSVLVDATVVAGSVKVSVLQQALSLTVAPLVSQF